MYVCYNCLTYFQDPDVSVVTNPSSALCLLKALLSDDKLGYLVPSEIAKVISYLVYQSQSFLLFQISLLFYVVINPLISFLPFQISHVVF